MKKILVILLTLPCISFAAVVLDVKIDDPATLKVFKKISQSPEFKAKRHLLAEAYYKLRRNEVKDTGSTSLPKDLVITFHFSKDYKIFDKYQIKYITEHLSKLQMNSKPDFGKLKVLETKNNIEKEGGVKQMNLNILSLLDSILKNIEEQSTEQYFSRKGKFEHTFKNYQTAANKVFNNFLSFLRQDYLDESVVDGDRNNNFKNFTREIPVRSSRHAISQ